MHFPTVSVSCVFLWIRRRLHGFECSHARSALIIDIFLRHIPHRHFIGLRRTVFGSPVSLRRSLWKIFSTGPSSAARTFP
ncbi:unnamed protein product [Cylicocyclus nassatus]|uniref:Uncharacterized protein n=1 Tax=Cylicocyclus nassatus TaxID=53992 RepID=A0AA36H9L1_CYLNA|nr:unnamed protein product [Cylicocyclus nassatus]